MVVSNTQAQTHDINAQDVARGVSRYLLSLGKSPMVEVPFGNNRRIDIAALDKKGRIIAIEIKVSLSDFKNDLKWPQYLDYCDFFYFAVCPGFPIQVFDEEAALPDRCGLIIADKFQAHVVRTAAEVPMNAQRRRAETLRFARRAARRLQALEDPESRAHDRFRLL